MVQLTAFIMRLAATDSDHLLDNDGFGSDVRVSCEKAEPDKSREAPPQPEAEEPAATPALT